MAVSVIAPTMRPHRLPGCLANFCRQTYRHRELVLVLNNARFDDAALREAIRRIPNVTVIRVDGACTLGDALNRGIERSSGQFVAKMDDDDIYGPAYLSDLVMAAAVSRAEVVGKTACYMYLEGLDVTGLRAFQDQYAFVHRLIGASLFIRRDVALRIPFTSVAAGSDQVFCRDARREGCGLYAADPFNLFVQRRRDIDSHTWKAQESDLIQRLQAPRPGRQVALSLL